MPFEVRSVSGLSLDAQRGQNMTLRTTPAVQAFQIALLAEIVVLGGGEVPGYTVRLTDQAHERQLKNPAVTGLAAEALHSWQRAA